MGASPPSEWSSGEVTVEGVAQTIEQDSRVKKCKGEPNSIQLTALQIPVSVFIHCNWQCIYDGKTCFGKVYFYFRCRIEGREMVLAIISEYSKPDPTLLLQSHGTFTSCQNFGDNSLVVVDVFCLKSVVAMVPHNPPHSKDSELHFFLVERPGLDIANLGSRQEVVADEA